MRPFSSSAAFRGKHAESRHRLFDHQHRDGNILHHFVQPLVTPGGGWVVEVRNWELGTGNEEPGGFSQDGV